MSCVFSDILLLPCDPHWQGGLCHTLGCNGTNAARDTVYCAFLPAHWTLPVQLCKTDSIAVIYTTVSLPLHSSRRNTTYTWMHFAKDVWIKSKRYRELCLWDEEAWMLCYVTLVLTNIQMNICVYTLISHLRNLPSLPKDCWCHCISEEWLGLIYQPDFHLSPTRAQAFPSACYELSKF